MGCGLAMLCQRFPVIAFLLGRAGRRKWVLVDQVMLRFDWELLPMVLGSAAKSVIGGCVWGSWGLVSNEIKNTELPSWSCVI